MLSRYLGVRRRGDCERFGTVVVFVKVDVGATGFIPVRLRYVGDVVLFLLGDFVVFDEVSDGFGTQSGGLAKFFEGVPFGNGLVFLIAEQAVHSVPVIEAERAYHMSFDSALFEGGVEPAICDVVLFHYLFTCHPFAQVVGHLRGCGVYAGTSGFRCFVKVGSGDSDSSISL